MAGPATIFPPSRAAPEAVGGPIRLGGTGPYLGMLICDDARPSFDSRTSPESMKRPLRLDPLRFAKTTLANGLDVIARRQGLLPVVAVNLWYHVGSKNEERSQRGFAHLFEHLMFEGSEHYPGDFFKPLQRLGAGINGSTSSDRTNYFVDIPAAHLELALAMESDRMGHFLPALTDHKIRVQKDVVKNEYRQNVANRPYGMVWRLMAEAMYPPDHPYSWTTIGVMEDVEAADARRRRGVLPPVLRPRQRQPGHRRRHRRGPRLRPGRALLRHDPRRDRRPDPLGARARARRARSGSSSATGSSSTGSTCPGTPRPSSTPTTPRSSSWATSSAGASRAGSTASWSSSRSLAQDVGAYQSGRELAGSVRRHLHPPPRRARGSGPSKRSMPNWRFWRTAVSPTTSSTGSRTAGSPASSTRSTTSAGSAAWPIGSTPTTPISATPAGSPPTSTAIRLSRPRRSATRPGPTWPAGPGSS